MKKIILAAAAVLITATSFAKDIKEVVLTTEPEMECANCENKIKNQLRFEKGIKEINTDIPSQTITLKYDADKTTVDKLKASLLKIGYESREVEQNQNDVK
ncbi:MAG: cation transporter [Prevotella sp.]|nr:cation transporter [Bacteroides sp.]MCM1366272.1 cation transporter [Prevotella sp.]MCM1436324.1 cation transporter [Prevotella sp.]